MSSRLNGFAILRAVVGHPELFSDVRASVDKAALAILTAQLKARTFDLHRLKRTRKALGADTLALVLKHLSDTVPKSLIDRIDPHHPKKTTGRAGWARSHVMALASGAVTPEQGLPGPIKRKARSAKKRNKRRNRSRKKPRPQEDLIGQGFWATSVMAKPQRLSRSARKPR